MSEPASRICPECGAELQEDDLFCPTCLTRLPDTEMAAASHSAAAADAWGETSPGVTEGGLKPTQRKLLIAFGLIVLLIAAALAVWTILPHFTADRSLAAAEEQYRGGRLEGALAAYDRVLQQNPNNAEAYVRKGQIYYALGQDREAMAAFHRAVQLDPNAVEAWIGLGQAAYYQEEDDHALDALDKAIALNPGKPEAYRYLGAVRLRQGRYEEAATALSEAVRLDASDLDGRAMLGKALFLDGRPEDAIPHLETVFGYRQEDVETAKILSQAYNQTGRYDESANLLRTALEVTPDDFGLLSMLSEALYAAGEQEAAIATLNLAAERSSDAAQLAKTSLVLGQIARANGELDAAQLYLGTAVLLAPDSAPAKAELGWNFIDLGDCERALPWFQAALETDPALAAALDGVQTCK